MRDQVLLSLFVPGAEGAWIWKRVDAISGEETQLAALSATALPMTDEVRLDPRGVEAMILVRGSPNQLYRVALQGGAALDLPSHPHELVLDVGYDEAGRALFFYGDRNGLECVDDASGAHWVYEGQTYPFDPRVDGSKQYYNVLVSVYRLTQGGAFELLERGAVVQVWAGDLRNLQTRLPQHWANCDIRANAVAFIPNSFASSDPWTKQWGQGDEYLDWYRCDRGARKVFFRAYRESRGLAPPIVIETASGLQRLAVWDNYSFYSNDLKGELRGGHLLITNGTSVARVHALDTGAVVWEAPPRARVALWPAAT
jgi:hypothetical protein